MPNGQERGLSPLWQELLAVSPSLRADLLDEWIAQGRISYKYGLKLALMLRGVSEVEAERLAGGIEAMPPEEAESFARVMRELPEPEPTERIERVPKRFEPEPIPPTPPAGAEYYPFLERMGVPAMRGYYETRFPRIFGEFEAEAPEAREEWRAERWRREQEPERLKWVSREQARRVAEAKRALPQVAAPGVAPFYERYQRLQEEARGTERRLMKAAQVAKEELPDPFATYLAGYPFTEKFMELPPAERGFFPSRYRPPTRWLTY